MSNGPSSWDRLLAAWRASAEHHEWGAPATADEIALAEVHLGRSLPPALRALYTTSDGMRLVDGNLNVYPLRARGDEPGLVTESALALADELREADWRIPDEVVVIGDNGSDELFGIWLPARQAAVSPPVIEIAEGGEPAFELEGVEGLAVAGTGIEPFLAARTAYFLLLLGCDASALDALGVPNELREREPDDQLFADLHAWADPDLDDPDPHPYQRPVAAARLRERYGASAS